MVRLFIYYASHAPKAVILARHEQKKYQMFLWNTDTDAIEKGQWLTKHKIWTDKCAISNDGKYFNYVAGNYGFYPSYDYLYEVKSIVPYFTAIKIKYLSMMRISIYLMDDIHRRGPDISFKDGKIKIRRGSVSLGQVDVSTSELMINGECLKDFSEDVFEELKPPVDYPEKKIICED